MTLWSAAYRSLIGALSLTLSFGALAAHHESELPSHGERAMAIEVDAEVVAIDIATREMVLRMRNGEQLTTIVDPAVQRLDEVRPGDFLVVKYMAALAADLREPTEEELANPWVERMGSGKADEESAPGGAMVRGVRAVCTIEGMNRLLGTVTILDPRGKAHVIGDVSAERIESLRVGQTVVMTFTQAVAVGIEVPPTY